MTDPDLERIARRYAPRREEQQPPATSANWVDITLSALTCVGVVWFIFSLAVWMAER